MPQTLDMPDEKTRQAGEAVASQVAMEDETDYAAAAEKNLEKLELFSAVLVKRRDEWVRARASEGLDARWVEDIDQFNGEDTANLMAANMMTSVQAGFPVTTHQARASRSTVYVQITRQKTNAAVARLGDILLPTEERNFSIAPTPLPNMPAWVTTQTPPVHVPPAAPAPGGEGGNAQGGPAPTGMPSMPGTPMGPAAPTGPAAPSATGPAPAQGPQPPDPMLGAHGGMTEYQRQMFARHAEAKKRSEAMQTKIEDCLNQSDFNAECRRLIYDAGVLGTGVLKGPVVLSQTRKVWKRATDTMGRPTWGLDISKELSPASFRVDPRRVYPDPACGEDIQNGRGIYEVEQVTPKQVRDMAKQPGYIKTQLIKVLEEKPKVSAELRPLHDTLRKTRDLAAGEVYDHWMYWGEIDRDDAEAAGIKVPKDVLVGICACVEMINDTVVRAYMNPLPGGELPYDFFQWERRPGSVWGYGVPYLMRSQQRVINAAWRMILDNAGVSSGPQIVIKPGLITPADQNWTLSARKIWYATDDVEDVSKAFATFEFNAHQVELQAIIEMAEKLSDAETAVPMLTQGESGSAPDTLGGMQMLMQSANVVLKRLVKQYDDTITRPHIQRYYSYLMEYDPEDELKGDYSVVALGSSSLVVRDVQHQALTQMLQLAANPVYAPLINSKNLFMKALRAQHLDPTDVMNTDAEIQSIKDAQAQAQANGGNDPRIQAAKLRSDADLQRTQAQVQMAQQELQSKQSIAQASNEIRLQELSMMRDIEMLKVAQQERISVEQVKAQLAQVAIKSRTTVELRTQDRIAEMQKDQGPAIDPMAGEQAAQEAQQTAAEAATQRQYDRETQIGDQGHQAAMQAMQQAHEQQLKSADQKHQERLARAQHAHDMRAAKLKPAAGKPAAKKPSK